jgi:hypothetical protein
MVNQIGELKMDGKKRKKGPIQLAWRVNQISRVELAAPDLLHHPGKLDGVAGPGSFSL